jgi:6-phosphofructokinase 2
MTPDGTADRPATLTVTLNPTVDLWTSVPAIEPERKLHCATAETSPGGGGINVARAMRNLGAEAVALFPYGGSTGEILCDLLRHERVPIRPVRVSGATRENLTVTEQSSGRQFRFVLPGPSLSPTEWRACLDEIERATVPGGIVVISGSLPTGTDPSWMVELVKIASRWGSRVIVDTSGPALMAAAHAGVYLLKPSVHELADCAGRTLTTFDEIADAARRLQESGPTRAVLVSLAADGAMLVVDGLPPRIVEAPRVDVISAVGAGDSLVAGLVVALEAGCDVTEAARRGVAAGTAATMTRRHSLCQPDEAARLLPAVRARALCPQT